MDELPDSVGGKIRRFALPKLDEHGKSRQSIQRCFDRSRQSSTELVSPLRERRFEQIDFACEVF
jgi:hypothetical protein